MLYKITVQSGTLIVFLIGVYVRMFLHSIGVSLAESFNLVSNVWHVEITM